MANNGHGVSGKVGDNVSAVSNSAVSVKVVIGSTRARRYADKPARWIADEMAKEPGVRVEVLDLRDFPMPFFDEPVSPLRLNGNYSNEVVRKWATSVSDGDAFIVIAPEYNRGYTAVLKNAFDSIYPEWNDKAIGFLGYGNAGGARSIEQLRQVVIELKMVPIRLSLHLSTEIFWATKDADAPLDPEVFQSMREGVFGDRVGKFFNELIATAKLLKQAREDKYTTA